MTIHRITRHQVRVEIKTFCPVILKFDLLSIPNVFNVRQFLDDRFCQYNIKEVLYDVRSQYQHILICDTVDTGRLLVLDGLANLAETDTICYTHSLLDMTKVYCVVLNTIFI